MPNTATVYARIEPKLKEEVDSILKELGVTPSSLIQMLYSQIKLTKRIPFDISIPKKSIFIEDLTKEELNYDEIIKTINETLNSIVNAHSEEEFKEVYQPKIVQITERYLGKGKKISMASRDQVEQLKLISEDLKEV